MALFLMILQTIHTEKYAYISHPNFKTDFLEKKSPLQPAPHFAVPGC